MHDKLQSEENSDQCYLNNPLPLQGSYPFSGQKVKDFSRTFQDPTLKFQGLFFSKNLPQTKQNSRTLYFVYLNICFHWLLFTLRP